MMDLYDDKIEPLLQKILNNREDSNGGLAELSAYLAGELVAIGKVTAEMSRIQSLEHDAKLEHIRIMANIDAERSAIRNKCPHYVTTYHGDASGGSDSHTTCDICGVEL